MANASGGAARQRRCKIGRRLFICHSSCSVRVRIQPCCDPRANNTQPTYSRPTAVVVVAEFGWEKIAGVIHTYTYSHTRVQIFRISRHVSKIADVTLVNYFSLVWCYLLLGTAPGK